MDIEKKRPLLVGTIPSEMFGVTVRRGNQRLNFGAMSVKEGQEGHVERLRENEA